jgi:hypothetical protein
MHYFDIGRKWKCDIFNELHEEKDNHNCVPTFFVHISYPFQVINYVFEVFWEDCNVWDIHKWMLQTSYIFPSIHVGGTTGDGGRF